MTKDQFIYGLTACGCLLKDDKTWYEHNELIKCFEDLGLFEQEPFINKPCVSSGVCEHDKNKVLDKIRADYENRLKADMVAMLTEIREKAWHRHSKYEDEKDFEVDKAVEDIVNHIDAKINSLKGEENVD